MLPKKFIDLMTQHADEIVGRIVSAIREHPRTAHYHSMSVAEMRKRIMGIFKNLERWVLGGDEEPVYQLYHKFGRTRYYEGVPLPDLMFAFILVKNHFRDFIKTHIISDTALQLQQEIQVLERMSAFFDDVFYFTISGYQEAGADEARKRAGHVHN